MNTPMEIGKKIVALSNHLKLLEAVDTLYSPSVVSIEASPPPDGNARVEGIANVRAKNESWIQNHEIHSIHATGPWPHGDRFVVNFKIDVTPKAGPMAGHRFTMEEAALYTTAGGKITREEFFYSMG